MSSQPPPDVRHETFHLERFFAATEFSTPHLLAVSDCESRTVGDLLSLESDAETRFHALRLGYTESAGSPELRAAIADRYAAVAPSDVLVHATAVEVIHTTMHALLQRGDRVVVQMPSYQALRSSVTMAGAEVLPWWGDPENGWAPCLDELDRLLAQPRVRMLVLNTPHNPTGWLASDEECTRIVERAERRGVWVFCDEAYRGTRHDGVAGLSLADRSPSVLALGLVSKGLGLPGLRTGWLVARDPDLRGRVERYKDFTSICGAAPSEFLAAIALRHADRILDDNRRLLHENLALLTGFMDRHAHRFRWTRPLAGPIAFPRLRDAAGWGGAETFCGRAREESGVLIAPGALFSDPSADPDDPRVRTAAESFRVGFGRAGFTRGLGDFEEWLIEAAPE